MVWLTSGAATTLSTTPWVSSLGGAPPLPSCTVSRKGAWVSTCFTMSRIAVWNHSAVVPPRRWLKL